MNFKTKIFKGLKFFINSDYRFAWLAQHGKYRNMSDSEYLKRLYKYYLKKNLNLNEPKTFNEKLQWLKLHDRNPNYTILVDKYAVREYIKKELGEEYLIPLLSVWDNAEDINFDLLPKQFVLKCNHNSGLGMCICKDKDNLHLKKIKKELNKGLKQNYYLTGREWPYKNVPRKIIAEKYMVSGNNEELMDYKVHSFNGEPKFILVCSKRFSEEGLHEDFYDINWERMDLKRPNIPISKEDHSRPENLEEMLEITRKLTRKIPFARVDFYIINGQLYFGEITFFPASGFGKFEPESWDLTLGNMLKLE